MKRFGLTVLVSVLVASVLLMVVSATSDEEKVEATWEVGSCSIDLKVRPPRVDLGTSMDGEDLERLQANTIGVESNCKWVVTLREDDGVITYQGNYPDPNKPVGDFKWRVHGGGGYNDLSAAPQVVAEGEPGGHEFQTDYKVDVRSTDPPGRYAAQLIYTATTP